MTTVPRQNIVCIFKKLPPYNNQSGFDLTTYSSGLLWQAETLPLDHAARAFLKELPPYTLAGIDLTTFCDFFIFIFLGIL
jgi:hypothetical protein